MIRKDPSGFGHVGLILAVLVIAVLGGVGWYVYDRNNQDGVANFEECVAAGNPVMESYPRQCSANSRTFSENIDQTALKSFEIEKEKLSFKYDPTYWRIDNHSVINGACGTEEHTTVDHGQGDDAVSIYFRFGSCGKGGVSCYEKTPVPDTCKQEAKILDSYTLDDQPVYFVATRSTEDGSNWEYGLYLTHEKDCKLVEDCGFQTKFDYAKPTNVDVILPEGLLKSVDSLDEFTKIDELRRAMTVLKTLSY